MSGGFSEFWLISGGFYIEEDTWNPREGIHVLYLSIFHLLSTWIPQTLPTWIPRSFNENSTACVCWVVSSDNEMHYNVGYHMLF